MANYYKYYFGQAGIYSGFVQKKNTKFYEMNE
jgi:hypothetical protein